ncbi:L-rhamnose mutarotase [Desulfosporosinus sp. SB140]|uniref:L-rhamnose mutarotase n=1 Tax=Desulfosporosinus paludis TaxID=3115649 RepID=UPI00388FBE83
MLRKAFIMKLLPGNNREYEKRHAEIWPDMVRMLKENGANNYSIHLDPNANTLFAYLEIEDEEKWKLSAETEICQNWWAYMKDIMETNSDNSPVTIDLKEVFYLK